MSGTLISSLVWVPRGRAALQPKKYELDESELERVGKLGGPGVLEQLKEQMEKMEMADAEGLDEGDWEDEDEDDEDDEESGSTSGSGDKMEDDGDSPIEEEAKPHDPTDMSAFKMEDYDDDVANSGGRECNILGKRPWC